MITTENNIQAIILKGTLEEINHLMKELDRFCNEMGLDNLIKNQINLILEELYTNTLNYGFQGKAKRKVTITLSLIDSQLEITYEDNGIAFNPLKNEDPDLMLSLDDRAIGGLGVFFVKAMTDHVTYSRVGKFNRLKMQKKI